MASTSKADIHCVAEWHTATDESVQGGGLKLRGAAHIQRLEISPWTAAGGCSECLQWSRRRSSLGFESLKVCAAQFTRWAQWGAASECAKGLSAIFRGPSRTLICCGCIAWHDVPSSGCRAQLQYWVRGASSLHCGTTCCPSCSIWRHQCGGMYTNLLTGRHTVCRACCGCSRCCSRVHLLRQQVVRAEGLHVAAATWLGFTAACRGALCWGQSPDTTAAT